MAPRFPLAPTALGLVMVKVTVGADSKWKTKTYMVHKKLLCRASEYFDKALNGPYREKTTNKLSLSEDCPVAFAVLHRWMYTGSFGKPEAYIDDHEDEPMDDDCFWLEVYRFGHCHLVTQMQMEAYKQLCKIFNSLSYVAPSVRFIEEVFDSDYEEVRLQQYIVRYIISHMRGTGSAVRNWEKWEHLFTMRSQSFVTQVAIKLAMIGEMDSSKARNERCHPRHDTQFRDYRCFASSITPATETDSEGKSS